MMLSSKHIHQQGFTLLEVMVALLIIAVGMLGVAGMQTIGLSSGSLAAQRLSVVMKVQEIAERIRVNSGAVNSYVVGAGNAGANNACFNAANCTAVDLAAYDVYLWKQDIKNILPDNANTQASITIDNATPTTQPAIVAVNITWDSMLGTQQYTTTFFVDSTNNVLD